VDQHILADPDPDPDPGSQNLADPTDPDPKHCIEHSHSQRRSDAYSGVGLGG